RALAGAIRAGTGATERLPGVLGHLTVVPRDLEDAPVRHDLPARRAVEDLGAHHSKKRSRSNGQNRRITFPMIRSSGCGPKDRESLDATRLSPSAKNESAGTFSG